MRSQFTIATCALLLVPISAPASAAGQQYGVWGFGTQSCGTWTADKQKAGYEQIVDISWVEGYMSAMDRTNPAINVASHHTDANGMAAWVDNYCAAHPIEQISAAAEAFAAELLSRPK